MPRTAVVIGGGIVGLAVAERLSRPGSGCAVTVLEKEDRVAAHQTGRNSGVIHSGVYYRPGSLKARACRRGGEMLIDFCAEHGVAHERCGKIIVAVNEREAAQLGIIAERGRTNGVTCRMLGRAELGEHEPHAAGVAALHVAETGIVDFVGVCEKLVGLIESRGGLVLTGARAEAWSEDGGETVVASTSGDHRGELVVNCAGLHSDRVARMAGARPRVRIVPFRGEYFKLSAAGAHLCRNLIYPTPNPQLPFLGVHFTRMVGGGVECGPNAVPALAREGYSWREVSARDMAGSAGYPGYWLLLASHPATGAKEIARSLSKRLFARALRRLVPEVTAAMLEPIPSGVRAQAVSPSGRMLDDFVVERSERAIHVLNAPSPAATSALAIAEHVVRLVDAQEA